jgi:DNA repair protein RecN (Recombination protein N)
MLDTLHIRNFALIDDLVLPWKPGLNVLTGETGAGKSIIVDAMSLLLGERAATAFIRKGSSRADIEALFDITHHAAMRELLESFDMDSSGDEVVLRRVISAEGKSRCFVNGTIVTLATLSKVGALLVDMHGQHEHQSLMQPGRHLALLDDFAGLGADTACVAGLYKDLKNSMSTLENLRTAEASRGERSIELREELALFDEADLIEDEEESIRSRRNLIANSEKIHRLASSAYDALFAGESFQHPLVNTWDDIMSALGEIADIDKDMKPSLEGYEDVQFRLQELAQTLQSYISGLEYDAGELEALERRLETISKLRRRHSCGSFDELLELRERMRKEYEGLTGSKEERARVEREVKRLGEEIGAAAFLLSQKRSEAANQIERKILAHLRDLGMLKARFEVSLSQEEVPDGPVRYKNKSWKISPSGADRAEFLFSANVGEPIKPLRQIASGGEISRIMLAIRSAIAETEGVPLIIFDEIDTGIGAGMGMTIAEKLAAVADSRQVICITHLPQIAAMADNHVVVDKQEADGRTRTDVAYPQGAERVDEIARMLGGSASGKITQKHAQELLALAGKRK